MIRRIHRQGSALVLSALALALCGTAWLLGSSFNAASSQDPPKQDAPKEEEEEHGGEIVFFVQSRTQKKSVVFSHEAHLAAKLDCKNCHEEIFKKEFGANRFKMKDVNGGKFCGVCHQVKSPEGVKGSFAPKNNCDKCHTVRVRPLVGG